MEKWMFRPPVLVGERVVWLGSGTGIPQGGIVRWIGKLPEMGPDWTVGLELDNPLPYGGIDGTWGNRQLFTCAPKHGLLVPISKIVPEYELFKWPIQEKRKHLRKNKNDLLPEVHPEPPVRHRVQTRKAEKVLQQKNKEPVINDTSSKPQPAARRRKLQKQLKTLSVIQEPAEPESDVNSDYKTLPVLLKFSKATRDKLRHYSGSLKSLKSSKSYKSYRTCRSGDYSEYQWYDAKDEQASDFQDCYSNFYEPIEVCETSIENSYNELQDTLKQSLSQSAHNEVEPERMSYLGKEANCNGNNNWSTHENGKLALNGNTSNEQKTIFSNVSPENTSGSRKEKGTSGFFSFLKWFRKAKAGDEEDNELEDFAEGLVLPSVPSTPKLIRTQSSSCGSIDTLFSTATVNSFAFVTPTSYRPFGTAETPEKWIAIGPDTETYKKRLFQRDKLREQDKNLSLKKKYKLFGSDTLIKGGAAALEISSKNERLAVINSKDNPNSPPGSLGSSFARKKRRAPLPPIGKISYSDYSLPNTLEHKSKGFDKTMDNGDSGSLNKSRHKRSASESCKDKKAGAYCHVKGKRKAPAPPDKVIATNIKLGNLSDKHESQFPSLGRKKRPAPPPPVTEKIEGENIKRKKGVDAQSNANKGKLSIEEKERLIANIDKLRVHANRNSLGSPPSSPVSIHLGIQSRFEQVVSNDSLKLEKGVLKPTKEMPKLDSNSADNKVAPVSPRPWYKRSLSSKENNVGSVKKDLGKGSDKKRDREKEMDWLIEGGIPRGNSTVLGNSVSGTNSKFNIFSRLDKGEEKKREGDKRKSQISMLANISELDREAAEIVQKEQAREQAIMAANDAKFYSHPDTITYHESSVDIVQDDSVLPTVEVPKRSSARELISLFNAISNVTKVTVNSTFFSKDGSKFISKEGVEKRFSYAGESFKSTEERVVIQRHQEVSQKRQSMIINTDPLEGTSSGILNQTNAISYGHSSVTGINILSSTDLEGQHNKTSSVTIEEVEDNPGVSFKGKQMYKGNKTRLHHSPSPSIPTIAEQSETTSLATTPGSTMNPHSNRESTEINIEDIKAASGSIMPKPLQEAKRVTIWTCPRCTLENPRWKLICDACGHWRPSLTDEKIQNLSPCTTTIASSELKPVQKNENKKPVNWEEELKRYFPKETFKKLEDGKVDENLETKESIIIDKGKSEINKSEGVNFVEKIIKETGISTSVSVNNHNEEQTVTKSKSSGSSVLPPTFIGGRNQHEKQVPQKVFDGKSDLNTPTTAAEPDMQEIRKARLAFFKQTADKEKSIITNNNVEECNNTEKSKSKIIPQKLNTQFQEDDKQRLKEMLKEMKNSLPKRPKTTLDIIKDEKSKTNEVKVVQVSSKIKEMNNQNNHNGAIKKIPMKQTKNITSQENLIPNKVDAAIISKDHAREDVQPKKNYGLKPLKVSTSAQTNSVIRKIETNGKDEIKHVKEPVVSSSATLLPATVEELSDNGIKEGVLVTSLTKKGHKIGKGTFELIRARDFASIEATKTGNETGVVHVYANYPTTSNNIPTKQSEKDKNIKDHSVIRFLQPTEKCSEESSTEGGNSERSQSAIKTESIPKAQASCADVGLSSPDLELQRKNHSSGALSIASNLSLASSSGDNSEVERLTAQLTLPKGLADFKADLKTCPPEKNMNTLAVNRLLRRLEAAIAGGQHHQAAGLARDLARLKISCSVIRQRRTFDSSPLSITVDMYVEDKVSHQGPIPLQVTAGMTVAQLKEKVQKEFEIPAHVQRWILGKVLASDDSKTLADHNVNSDGCPMFLYLVAPDIEPDGESNDTKKEPRLPEPLQLQPTSDQPNDEKPGGWYYNYEEDRYSFCEESESDNADDEASSDNAQVKNSREKTNDQAITVVTNVKVENLKDEDSGEEEVDEEEEEEEETEDDSSEEEGAAALPVKVTLASEMNEKRLEAGKALSPKTISASTSQKTFQPIKAVMQPIPSAPLLQKVDVDNQELNGKREKKTDTLKLGWICPVCTLVNSPTRPGCAACTTERPIRYVVPIEYRANEQELQRMQREQELDNDMEQAVAKENDKDKEKQTQHYLQLVDLDKTDLVPNIDPFDCSVCLVNYPAGEGVVLRECLHTFCRTCLSNTVQFSEEAEVKCPYRDATYACDSTLQEREIKALVPPQVYENHLAKSVTQAENKIGNAFHCKTPDCRGWCIFEDNVNEFRCPVCMVTNCLTCQAIHEGVNCRQFQEQVKQQSETNAEARRTKEMLEEMVERGEAMVCPTCAVVLMKKWGCDWLRCSMCKTEICWVTRGPRWGPGGKGDTTGGCQCGVNGIKCHPRCNYCH